MTIDVIGNPAAFSRRHDRRLSLRAAVLTIAGLSLVLWCGIGVALAQIL